MKGLAAALLLSALPVSSVATNRDFVLVGDYTWATVVPASELDGELEVWATNRYENGAYVESGYRLLATGQSSPVSVTTAGATGTMSFVKDGEETGSQSSLLIDADYSGYVLFSVCETNGAYAIRRLAWTDVVDEWTSADRSFSVKVPSPVSVSTLNETLLVTNAVPSAAEAAEIVDTTMVSYGTEVPDLLFRLDTSLPSATWPKKYVDALVCPANGLRSYNFGSTETGAAVGDSFDVVCMTPEFLKAVVWRYRHDNTRTIPVDLEHASTTNSSYSLMGKVAGMWYDSGTIYTNLVRTYVSDHVATNSSSWHWYDDWNASFREPSGVVSNGTVCTYCSIGLTRPGIYARIELSYSGYDLLAARGDASPSYGVSPAFRSLRAETDRDSVTIPWQISSIAITLDPTWRETRVLRESSVKSYSTAIPGVPRGTE